MTMTMTRASASPQETRGFAERFAGDVLAGTLGGRSNAFVVALSGELGAGKTTFVQGFVRGFGLRRRIVSPTFVFIRRYALQRTKNSAKGGSASGGKGQGIRFANFYHVDAYRVRSKKDLVGLGLKEIFADSGSLVLVEWAESVKWLLPKDAVWVRMRHGEHENERVIALQ